MDDIDVLNATRDDPEGSTCSYCSNPNNFADDCGWFILHPHGMKEGYACQQCYEGEPGKAHIARWGQGER